MFVIFESRGSRCLQLPGRFVKAGLVLDFQLSVGVGSSPVARRILIGYRQKNFGYVAEKLE